MTLHLDSAIEQRIQREIDLGHFTTPAEVITHALDLLASEEDPFPIDRERLEARLAESMVQAERGEVIAGDRILEVLAERRQQRMQTR